MKMSLFVTAIYILFSFIAPLGDTVNISSFAPREFAGFECVAGACDDECGDEYGGGIMTAAASSNGFQGYDNFAQAYFKGLTSNFGNNRKNSCGYVALAMLLAYYDNFISDDIVPECYDVTSVGTDTNMILRDDSPGSSDHDFNINVTSSTTGDDYFNLVENNQNRSLQARLIYLGQKLYGMYDFDDTNNENCVTYMTDLRALLHSYLQSESGLTPVQQYAVHLATGSSNSIRNEIISEIKRGNPVIVLLKKSGVALGHFCIAYDYDEATDKVYFHSGWHDRNTRRDLSTFVYDTYYGYLVVRFNMEHSHSNNYAVKQADGTYKYYCYCDEEIITYKHDECKYTYKYTANDGTHIAYCTCGNSIVQNHSYTHRYDRFNELQHIAYCACGKSVAQSHTWTLSGNGSALKKLLVCTGCKLSKPDDLKTPVTRD